jgi:hypothetical protein
MILFYSEFCQHCKILLETIERHDKNKIVKKVSVDALRSLKKPIDPKIHSVPALLLNNTGEYIFGKSVFDYLLLPNRGVLFANNGSVVKNEPKTVLTEPSAFTLGTIYSENFSSLENEEQLDDRNYTWESIGNNSEKPQIVQNTDNRPIDTNKEGTKKDLPSIEELMKQRSNDF